MESLISADMRCEYYGCLGSLVESDFLTDSLADSMNARGPTAEDGVRGSFSVCPNIWASPSAPLKDRVDLGLCTCAALYRAHLTQ